ncbi:MAG: flagellar biosynthesis anti-sigma factor FlgM [Thermosulfidibacteraceae bacterium]
MRINPGKFNIENLMQTRGMDAVSKKTRMPSDRNNNVETANRLGSTDMVEIANRLEAKANRIEELRNNINNNTYRVDERKVIASMLRETFTERFIK